MTDITVVIPTHDQVKRLRLVLDALAIQTLDRCRYEIVVVDDGCTDGTPAMLETRTERGLRVLSTPGHVGRSAARNLGAAAAQGELLVFLDGDAMPVPDLLEVYQEAFVRYGERSVLCGYQYVRPDLDFLMDPSIVGDFAPHTPSIVREWLRHHADEVVVRLDDGCSGGRRGMLDGCLEGGYPFPDSAERQRQVRRLLSQAPVRGGLRWVGFVPHNAAMGRKLFDEAQGFDTDIPFSEGWELAYRLQNHHRAVIRAVDACSVHLYHYHPFNDADGARQEAMTRYRALEYMVRKHGDPGIRMLYLWFAALWPDPYIPEEIVPADLVECDEAYRREQPSAREVCTVVLTNHPIIGHLATAGGKR